MDAEELFEFDKVRIRSFLPFKKEANLFLFFIYFFSSLWMNRTGIFIIGLRRNGRRLSDGRAQDCSRS